VKQSATRSLKQWDRIATRVVQVGSRTQISGAILPFDRDASQELLKFLHKLAKRAEKEKQKFADLVGRGVDNPAIVSGFSETAVLRAVAPTITNLWLIDAIDAALSPLIRHGILKAKNFCSALCIIRSWQAPRPTIFERR
jgi:hypothetical protein